MPPNTTVDLKLEFLQYLRTFSSICEANSRVGVRTSARIGFERPCVFEGREARVCTIGREKAAVLPVPVWALPRISLPSNTCGIACS